MDLVVVLLRDHQFGQRITVAGEAAEQLATDRILAARGLLGSQFRQAVGFRPVVTPLPEGTTLSVSGVISADRRYVRITPSPLFSGVTDVFTFNFVSGDQGTGPNPGGGGANPNNPNVNPNVNQAGT